MVYVDTFVGILDLHYIAWKAVGTHRSGYGHDYDTDCGCTLGSCHHGVRVDVVDGCVGILTDYDDCRNVLFECVGLDVDCRCAVPF